MSKNVNNDVSMNPPIQDNNKQQQQHFISHSHYMVCKKRMKINSKIEKEYSITI